VQYRNPLFFIAILLLTSISLVLASSYPQGGNLFHFTNGQELRNANSGDGNIKQAISSQVVQQSNGTTLHLDLGKAIKNINGSNVIMYSLNGEVPGPIIKVKQGSSIFVNFTNSIDMNS
jgi:Multicopper oxidase